MLFPLSIKLLRLVNVKTLGFMKFIHFNKGEKTLKTKTLLCMQFFVNYKDNLQLTFLSHLSVNIKMKIRLRVKMNSKKI